MELIFANNDFKVGSFSYQGFPLLLKKDMEILEEALDFFLYYLLKRGSVQSRNSWDTFGRDLYDLMAFSEENALDWHNINSRVDSNFLALYRDWALEECKLSPSTINRRLNLAIKFYRYAMSRGWVKELPYSMEEVRIRKPKGFLAHADRTGGVKARPDVMLKTPRTRIKVLSLSQIQMLLDAIDEKASLEKKSLKLMVRLCLLTGLRKEECLTFPVNYLIDPNRMPVTSHYVVKISPREMEVKGEVERTIHIPITLMQDLWNFKIHERNLLHNRSAGQKTTLFLNRYGEPYSLKSRTFNKNLDELDLPFKIHPHMLRHCYATHTLASLMSRKSLKFNPLIYVRDRLGHSSITTTEAYLHFIDDITE